jgi:hypothetical protein
VINFNFVVKYREATESIHMYISQMENRVNIFYLIYRYLGMNPKNILWEKGKEHTNKRFPQWWL